MPGLNRSIFRPAALHRYAQRDDRQAYPRLTPPGAFLLLWFIVTLALVAALSAWLVEIPVSVSGVGVAVGGHERGDEEVVMAVFLPAQELKHLREGQRVLFKLGGEDDYQSASITGIEPRTLSPQEVRQRFTVDVGASSNFDGPAAVAFARLRPTAGGVPASGCVGSSGVARVEIGSRRAVSLFPGVRYFLRDDRR